jgi:hypothetical protein
VTGPRETPSNTSGDDAAWRDIVANYGDRPVVDAPSPEPAHEEPRPEEPPELAVTSSAEERFVPPPPPPLPRVSKDRMAAWVGVLGAPVALLVATIFRIPLPGIVPWLLVGAFLGGFGYLVAQMPRGPRDPFDDGAVL